MKEKSRRLKRDLNRKSNGQIEMKLNRIDKWSQENIMEAESKLKSRGSMPFSARLVEIKMEKRYWKETLCS